MIRTCTYKPELKLTCPKWDLIDINFTTQVDSDPFKLHLAAEFRNGSKTLTVPAFYNGNQTWVIRFSPDELGEWSFVTLSNEPALSSLQGSIVATAPKPGKHGPVQPVPNKPQRLQFADGTPYHLLAFEADWLFALDADNETDIPKSQSLINHIAANGFNHVVMNVFANDVPWKKDERVLPEHEYGSPAVFPFTGTNDAPNFSELNMTYFQRFDRVMDALREAGIVSHLMIYVWNKLVNWPEMYSEADNRYFDYVIKRYQAFPNLVWDISKEALTYGRCDDAYILERIYRLRKQDAYQRMVTVHDFGFCNRHPESIDLFSIQTWQSGLYGRMKELTSTFPTLPIFNIEHGGYERSPYVVFPGDYDDPEICLARNYECLFAGTYSTYYWQASSWNVVIHDPENLPEAQQPKFRYYRYLADFMKRYEFSTLSPAPGNNSSGWSLSDNKSTWLYYLPVGTYATHISINRLAESTYAYTWFNPLTGDYSQPAQADFAHWQEFLVPDASQIWILVIEKQS